MQGSRRTNASTIKTTTKKLRASSRLTEQEKKIPAIVSSHQNNSQYQNKPLTLIRRDKLKTSKEDFSFKYSRPLYKAFDYEIVKAKCKKTNQKLLAKILDKEKTDILDREESVKNEILVHQNLQGNEFLLNMLTTFETKKHLYIMYERYDKPCPSIDSFSSNKSKQYLLLRVLICMTEINSHGICLSHFDLNSVVLNDRDEFKLFNLNYLTAYGQTSEAREYN